VLSTKGDKIVAKWNEKTKQAKTSTESLVPWRTTIEHNPDGSLKTMETHYAGRRVFEDGAELTENKGSILIIISELSKPDLAFSNNVDKAIQKLIGDRLPIEP
jgi:hypothetical protein